MTFPEASRRPRALFPAVAGVAALVLVFVIVVGVAFALLRGSDDAPPTDLARRVPADTQVFSSLDLDLTSDGWRAVASLLDILAVRDDAIAVRDDAFDEGGIDYAEEVAPVLAETVGIAVALTLDDDPLDDPLVVNLIETRDVPGLLDLIDILSKTGDDEWYRREDHRDQDIGLEIREFSAISGDEDADFVVASGDRLVYIAADLAHIRRLVREAEAAPLSDVDAFRELEAAAQQGLAFTYVDVRSLLDAFEEVLLEELAVQDALAGALDLEQQLEDAFDEAPAHWAATLSASGSGFSAEVLWLLDPDDPDLEVIAGAGPPDLGRAAAATPRDALFFATGAGLGASIQAAIDSYREDLPQEIREQIDDALDQFREETGLDLEDDLLPQLVGTFAFSLGRRNIDAAEPNFALFLTDAADEDVLLDQLREVHRSAEQACGCDSNVDIGSQQGFQYVGWPEDDLILFLGGDGLAMSANFEITRGLLQSDPLFFSYLDFGAILDELIEEGEVDLDGWNAAALRGFGLSWDIEDRVGRFRFVVPISDPEGGE